ncbi:dTDP-4-dehydrorhamnose 3,5-epimerase [Scytonema sp. HK-05]|uniref:dTDP-4-dehydrorhamnose 3,5-epimerase n=1 Tax=Scytonema sp. HK-05 TaxID=1137095 RepID=UPI000935AF1E|nr:dTDP-4-dehydrorhamnose 3,5-epimerase [Scytonema sp. HK-05]OKH58241.1 dTDP-4-dehydrorhamnose 3,5-epimerase [Scytonema sp. HK-05]BAY48373.1 dTDP-4-dehydrorhamnose 3,5-epimerase [Scytonema sp. HK-05]
MKILQTKIPDVLLIEPQFFEDERGFFYESYNERVLREKANIVEHFVQDNHSRSTKNVLRGLHYQIKQPQGKLIKVVVGEVFDVAVDLRTSSKYFGQWVGVHLKAKNKQQLWIPAGFAHGFLVISEYAETLYKTTDYYAPEYECCILWSDPDLAIAWPVEVEPILSAKDRAGKRLKEAEVFA